MPKRGKPSGKCGVIKRRLAIDPPDRWKPTLRDRILKIASVFPARKNVVAIVIPSDPDGGSDLKQLIS